MQFAFLNSLLFLIVLSCTPVVGQSIRSHEQGGGPYGLHLFSKDELPNQGQNWSIAQDQRGLMYVANHYGVLEYDGHTWRLIQLDNANTAFAVRVNSAGVVYVGSRNDFGYLTPDSTGTLVYKSLLQHVATDDRGFGIIWSISVTSDGIYFQANSHLFRWDGSLMESWHSDDSMHTSFAVHDRFYLRQKGVGLLVMENDSLVFVPGGQQFVDKRVFLMTPLEEDVLVGAQKDMDGPLELYRLDGEAFTALDVDQHLLNKNYSYTFYNGSGLSSEYVALATLYDGVFIIDQSGALVETLDADRGVDQDVNYTFSDVQGGLWLAHNLSGISYIGSPLGLSQYGESEGLAGQTNAVLRHQGHLYLATDNGLFRLRDRLSSGPEDEYVQFERVAATENSKGLYWSLISYGEELLMAAEHGVLGMRNDEASVIAFKPPDKPSVLLKSRFFDGRVYVGLETGLGMLTRLGNEWNDEKLGSVERKINSMAEGSDGSLWFSTTAPCEVWRLRFNAEGRFTDQVKVIESGALGVPSVWVEEFDGEIRFMATPKGVFRLKEGDAAPGLAVERDERFPFEVDAAVTTNALTTNAVPANQLVDIARVSSTSYWTLYRDRLVSTTIQQGEHQSKEMPGELMLPAWKQFKEIYADDNGVVWISNAGLRPLLKYDPSTEENMLVAASHPPVIRSMTILWADSVLYGGAFSAASASAKFKKGETLSVDLHHEDNDLRFEYAMPNYNKQDRVEYRYILNGHDEMWSKWTGESTVIYRNIEPGDLSFEVQARVGGMPVEGTASAVLTIRAPWFWSWWMKLFYLLFLGYAVTHIVRYQRAKKQVVLLNIERELNARLQLANTQLRTANDSLEQANRMKDEFLANASHELRTPLTAILGFTSVLKEEVPEENLEFLGLINENGKRLLKTINSLLDLAKLRAGMLELKFESLDIGEKTEEVVDLLAQLAKNQNLYLEVEKPDDILKVMLDAHYYERVLYNLIGNAIKFTSKGGVRVQIERKAERVLVHVIDTGIGIDQDFIPLLFDEFKQEPNNEVRTEGSGLGLTITAQLVALLGGEITVQSTKGRGSTFTVAFQVDELARNNTDGKDTSHSGERTQSAMQ